MHGGAGGGIGGGSMGGPKDPWEVRFFFKAKLFYNRVGPSVMVRSFP